MNTLSLSPVEHIPKAGDTPVDNLIELYKTCLHMEAVCLQNSGIGLSAVQVGIPWKLFIVRRGDKFDYFVNCDYTPDGEERIRSVEGCLSLRTPDGENRIFKVERYKTVRVVGHRLTVQGMPTLVPVDFVERDDLYSIVYQHEIDHNYGRDRMIDVIGQEIELRR